MKWGFLKAFSTVLTGSEDQNANNWVTASTVGNKRALDVLQSLSESTANSTTTPLSSGAIYTGSAEQNNMPHLGVMVKTDQAGTLYFDFSGGGSPRVQIKAYAFNRNVATRYELFRTTIDTASTTNVILTKPIGIRLSPTDVFYWVADTDTNSTEISCRFSLLEYKIN